MNQSLPHNSLILLFPPFLLLSALVIFQENNLIKQNFIQDQILRGGNPKFGLRRGPVVSLFYLNRRKHQPNMCG